MATKKNVVAIKQDIPEQIETLRADIKLLADTVKKQAKTTASAKVATAKDAAVERVDATKAKYDELTSSAESRIKDNPLTAVAIAVGAGLLLGAVTRR
ncbi:MAG: DUF883 family protein [Hyphomonadaceae bacterium]|nr:DUF883 family protein [Hyphomonadaceae bacterium]